jgi:hypothetical protein
MKTSSVLLKKSYIIKKNHWPHVLSKNKNNMNSLAPEQTRMPVQPLLIIFFDIIKLILLKKIIVQEILS